MHPKARTVVDTELRQRKQETLCETVKLAATGDTAAFTRLILDNEAMLYRVCKTILRSEADCADAVQDAVITAWRRIGQLRSAESFPAWAARICINCCYRLARKSRRDSEEAPYVNREAGGDARLDVMSAVAALPENLRLPVVFYYFEDWSVEQTARALGLMRGTVKSRLHTARRLLSEALQDYKEGIRDDAR